MLKKVFAVLTIAFLALVAAPTAANAAGYVPSSNITVAGDAVPGNAVTVNFASTSFTPNEEVAFSVSGNTTATLSTVKAAVLTTLTKQASSTGAVSVNVTLPANASGTYTLTATGLTSGNVGTASITTVPASAANAGTSANGTSANGTAANAQDAAAAQGSALANTGATLPMLMIWIGGGALVLGVAVVATLGFVRRQRNA